MTLQKSFTGLACILMLAIALVSCKPPAWVDTAENIAKIALPVVGSLVSVIQPGSSPIVAAVQLAFNALIKTLDDFKASPSDTTLQAVQSAFAAVNSNVAELAAGAQIKNPKSAATVTAIVNLLSQAVTELAALIPPPPEGSALKAKLKVSGQAKGLKAEDLKKQFNDIVAGDPAFQPIP
jgi:hypothetical protein